MQLMPGADRGRFLAVVLLVAAVAVVYLLGVHWWFTAPHLALADEAAMLREQEARYRSVAAEAPRIEAGLREVAEFERSPYDVTDQGNVDAEGIGILEIRQPARDLREQAHEGSCVHVREAGQVGQGRRNVDVDRVRIGEIGPVERDGRGRAGHEADERRADRQHPLRPGQRRIPSLTSLDPGPARLRPAVSRAVDRRSAWPPAR